MLNIPQFKSLVIIPTLERMGPKFNSPDAVHLLLGTALHESRLTYLRQLPGGPALGLYQIEPTTINDIYENFLSYNADLEAIVHNLMNGMGRAFQAVTNLAYSTALARLVYYRISEKLPDWQNSAQVASYWKRHYNTTKGAGRIQDFEQTYRELVLD